jgi:exonuclease III
MGRKNPRNKIALLCLLLILAGPVARADSFNVLSQNMNRLFDDIDDGNNEKILSLKSFRQRINLTAGKFGEHFDLPHIIALQEVENLNVLDQIAIEIDKRYHLRYQLALIPGQDVSGINLGFLVRDDVEIKKLEQLFKHQILELTGNPLFSRPPLYLEACFIEKCISLLNLHLRSMRGIDSNKDGQRVARKRLGQAEAVAAWVNQFQQARPGGSLLMLGDFNALTPSDKHVDVAGILRGSPDNRTARLKARDMVNPNLVDLSRRIKRDQRYSYVFRQRKQQLDYMFINRGFAADLKNIEFSDIDRQFSDHAGLQAWFRW